MEKNSELYDFTQTLQGQIFYAAFMTNLSDEQRQEWTNRPPIMNLKRGYAESPNWIFVQALEFDPEALTVERFRKRAVYAAPRLTQALLELLASEQYFDRSGDEYHLTEKGHDEAQKIRDFRITIFDGFEPIDAREIDIVERYMRRIIDECMKSETPPGTWCIAHSRHRAPEESAPPLAKVIQYGSDFNAFRDDAHMAAYSVHHVEGHIWEAFSYVKSEQAQNAASLYEKLAYRGFYTEDWQNELNDLTKRGWIAQREDHYYAIDAGRAIAEDVEIRTDAYFYASWDVLAADEYEELIMLMQKLSEKCQALVATPA